MLVKLSWGRCSAPCLRDLLGRLINAPSFGILQTVSLRWSYVRNVVPAPFVEKIKRNKFLEVHRTDTI